VSVFFNAEFKFTGSFFHLYLYFTVYNENKEIRNICHLIVLLLDVPAVALVKWKLSDLSFEACQSSGPPAMRSGS